MNKEELETLLKKDFKIENEEIFKKLFSYFNLLISYNESVNLTTITDLEDVYIKHFYDSLLLSKTIDLTTRQSLLDIGSGAGFPGMVLKIVYPNLDVTLVESTGKKCLFLNQVIKELDLKDIKVVNERAEEYISNNRESFDIVTARAVSRLNILLELTIPYLKIGGFGAYLKSSNVQEEINEATSTSRVLRSTLFNTNEFNLPLNKGERTIVIYQKNNKTNPIYPRKYSNIKNKPL